jgi:hypothetical protein
MLYPATWIPQCSEKADREFDSKTLLVDCTFWNCVLREVGFNAHRPDASSPCLQIQVVCDTLLLQHVSLRIARIIPPYRV